MRLTKFYNFYLKYFLIFPKTSEIFQIILTGHPVHYIMQLVIKNNRFIPNNKNTVLKVSSRIFKKFLKMIKNTKKYEEICVQASKNLNICINWEKQCFKALKEWLR